MPTKYISKFSYSINLLKKSTYLLNKYNNLLIQYPNLSAFTFLLFHNQFLFYGKGGYASSLVEVNATSSTGVTARASQRENGWVVGGGIESRMVGNILFGLEYNYVSFLGDRVTGVTGGTGPAGPFNFDINNLQMHTVTARLSILFGPHGCCSEGLIGKY